MSSETHTNAKPKPRRELCHAQWHISASRRHDVVVARSLSTREHTILRMLLSVDFPGVAELRAQADSVLAQGSGLIVDLVVDQSLRRAAVTSRTPVQAVVDGDGYDEGLILFVDDGRLSALECWWVTEDKPDELPPLSAVGQPVVTVE